VTRVFIVSMFLTCSALAIENNYLLEMDFESNLLNSTATNFDTLWHGSESYDRDGHLGTAISLSSQKKNYVVVKHDDSLGAMGTLYISLWAKKEKPYSTGTLIKKSNQYGLSIKKNNSIVATLINDEGESVRLYHNRLLKIKDTQWHHYSIHYDGTMAQLLVDDEVVSEKTFSGDINNDIKRDLYIGSSSWNSSFNGSIDEVKIAKASEGDTEYESEGFSKDVSVEMGEHTFTWRFSKAVEWGYFIDGQPWVVRPNEGVKLVHVTPKAITQSMKFNGKRIEARIHQTVINPPIATSGSTMYPVNSPSFGWDSRVSYKKDWDAYNPDIAWNPNTPAELNVGDSIVSAKSVLDEMKGDGEGGVLAAIAVLTVLDEVPPSDAFRPGAIREGSYRSNPEIIRYSDIIELDNYMIKWPTTALITDVEKPADYLPPKTHTYDGGSGAENFTTHRLKELMRGPFVVNTGDMEYRYTYGHYNNVTDYDDNITTSRGYRQFVAMALGDLAIGSLAEWLPKETRKLCRIRLIQNGIDTFHVVESGLIIEQDGGHVSGWLTLMSVVGTMLDHKKMLQINSELNGENPELALNGVAQNFILTDKEGSDEEEYLWINYHNPDIKLNKEKFKNLTNASTHNTFTVKRSYQWDVYRPGNGLYNMKVKITAGKGAGDQIYVVTDVNKIYDEYGKEIPKDSALFTHIGHPYGGTLSVKSDESGRGWVNGMPDKNSEMTFSVYTNKDVGKWEFCRKSIVNKYGSSAYYNGVMKRITSSPDQSYLNIVTGTELSLLIALYALDAEDVYDGKMDNYLIRMSQVAGFGEYLFSEANARHITGTRDKHTALGGLWREQVLDKVGVTFKYSGRGMRDLRVPKNSEKLWNE